MRIKGINKAKFKKALREKTGCSIQHNGWTCGTCFFAISKTLNNFDWRSLLLYRGDYTLKELGLTEKDIKKIEKSINKIWELIK